MDTILSPARRRVLRAAGAAGACGTLGGLGALTLAGCSERPAGAASATPGLLQFSGQTMGTSYVVKLAAAALSATRLEALQAGVHDALEGINRGLSLHRADSELMRFNRHASAMPFALSKDFLAVLAAAQQVSELSAGAFDVSVAPLTQAWGFGPEHRSVVPAAAQIEAGRAAVGWRGLQLDAARGTVTKTHAGLQADLGGIAKGHGVDLAALALEAGGVEHYMVEVGGEVRTRGHNPQGRAWQIGIEEPDAMPQRARSVVPLSGRSLATSGDYRFYFEQDGRRYSHEIDPRTAEPISHGLASVSVVADSCMLADALATALIVMGPERGFALAQQLALPALFIVREPQGGLRDQATPAYAALTRGAAA
ncbi:MAG: FAD:protein FMN transferase [Rubrivivax sp.]|nr:FAD:protein FMN transferase [Rubrivivax sp.]